MKTKVILLSFFTFATLLVWRTSNANAATLWSWGDNTAGLQDNGWGLNPTGDGCYSKSPGDEFNDPSWTLQTSGTFMDTQAECSSFNWQANGWIGARFNGPAGTTTTAPTTTTTTIIPPTTTTTVYPPPTVGGNCGRTDEGGSCLDQVNMGTPVNITSCNTAANNTLCSPFWIINGSNTGSSGKWYNSPPASEWKLVVRGSEIHMTISRNGGADNQQYGEDWQGLCVAHTDGSYSKLGGRWMVSSDSPLGDASTFQPINNGSRTAVLPRNVAYMWRARNGTFGDVIYDPNCAANDPSGTVQTLPNVLTPAVNCVREFFTTVGGVPSVRIRATAGNVSDGATDVLSIRFPWENSARLTSFAETALPSTGMPSGGWRGTCMLARTVNVQTHRGSNGWKAGANQWMDAQDTTINPRSKDSSCPTNTNVGGGISYECAQGQTDTAFVGAAPFTPLVPIIAGGGVNPATLGAPVAVGAPLYTGVPAAAAVGWTLGGFVAGVGEAFHLWEGDDEWFCRWNPGYKAFKALTADPGEDYCSELTENRPYLRQGVQLEDQFGEPVFVNSVQRWTSGTAIAEVLIDPTRPEMGQRTTTALEAPAMTDEETTALQNGLAHQTGEERAAAQKTNPPYTEDPTATEENDPVAPPPFSEDGDCDSSFWELLNPFNIASTMSCFLRKLFIPDDGWDGLASLWGNLTNKVPFSYMKQAVLFIPSLFTRIGNAASEADCMDILPNGLENMPGVDGAPTIQDKFGCPQNVNSVLHPAAGFFATIRGIVSLLFLIGLAFAVFNVVTWALG